MVVEAESEISALQPNFAPFPCLHRNPQAVIPGAQQLQELQGSKEESFWKEGKGTGRGPLSHCPPAQPLYSPWAPANPAACNVSLFLS